MCKDLIDLVRRRALQDEFLSLPALAIMTSTGHADDWKGQMMSKQQIKNKKSE